jgi:hypothetical protein
MTTFAWPARLKFGLLAALVGWLAGWAVCIPFELSLAWRYVDGNGHQLPDSLVQGLVVWAGFSLFMAMAGFLPLMLPLVLLIPPRWWVRWRGLLIPGAPLVAILAIYRRMGMLHLHSLTDWGPVRAFFFTAPNIFVVTFALVVVWAYVGLAKRRLTRPTANAR